MPGAIMIANRKWSKRSSACPSDSNVIPKPLGGTANEAVSDMVRYATEPGMTPSARFRLAVDGVGRAALSPPTTVN